MTILTESFREANNKFKSATNSFEYADEKSMEARSNREFDQYEEEKLDALFEMRKQLERMLALVNIELEVK